MMLAGLWMIIKLIIPIPEVGTSSFFIGIVKVILSALLSLFWLWVWREMAVRYFWYRLKRSKKLA